MTSKQHSIIGLPGSGKTTFLAALWHLLDAGEVSSKFTLEKLSGDNTYLNNIVEAWRKCDEVPRTSIAAESDVSIHVRNTATSQTAILHFSDLSGESFDQQFAKRTCSKDYVQGFESDGGILLFVTADRASEGMTILDLPAVAIEDTPGPLEIEHPEWSPEKVPTQVRLVDLLQFIQHPPFRHGFRRLAVIISAWDVIDTPNLQPIKWLERELPLLFQFLKSNPDTFDFQVYGVSAQGGDVTGPQKSELVEAIPSQRIACVGPNTEQHDLTSPIAWLMSGG
ncbi:MAG: hypothetical protein V9E92_07425 [Methylotenera sp.]